MSALVSRLLLTMLMFPLAAVCFIFCIVVGLQLMRGGYRNWENWVFLGAGLITDLFVIGYWMLLWARSVRWTHWRIGATLIITFGSTIVGVGLGFLTRLAMDSHDSTFAMFVGTAVAPIVWLGATILVWRENKKERLERLSQSMQAVICPTCGYNLTGLSSTRCPECGAVFTLDQLMAQQPVRPVADLEPR